MTPATVIRPAAVAPMVGGPFVLGRVLLLRPEIGPFPPLLGHSLQLSQAHVGDGGRW